MRLTYNPDRNVAYFSLQEKQPEEPCETIKISDDVWFDLSPDGRVYGIELLNPNALLQNRPILSVMNEVTHAEQFVTMR